MTLHGAYFLQQLQRIKCTAHFAQLALDGLDHAFGLQKSLAWRFRWMVSLGDLRSLPMFLSQLEGGLKEVDEQSRCAVQPRERLRRGDAFKPTIAKQLAHDSTVLLLDPRLIVLP